MDFIELLKVIFLGIVEGITEWLPVSSTGHMILVDEFIKLNMTPAFMEMFFVVIQLGAIMAVVCLFWDKLFPFEFKGGFKVKTDTMNLWFKIAVACVPAAIIGLLFDDVIDEYLFNPVTVALMLILYGVLFIVIENRNKGRRPMVNDLSQITYKFALMVGIFQLLALVPGTSRSGATIVGAILIGASRYVASEFTFFLAIPVMLGASLLKILKFGLVFTASEAVVLGTGTLVAFFVSILAIKFLMGYIKKHDFKVFGWYRIILGIIVLAYFFFFNV
ncbi:MAG: undecaprenyl-diphosphate phosphatase [Turicibacter sp.]|uniref:Undecaprenyl-diphosphatase n=1 Tax=Turicibacter faecis TaxID=2963365 RepID=A0ABM8IQ98_9FIRM|nr:MULTISPECIES: undecaprenyl-diphosphate phosphatase [unclassified Turicibacter]MCI8701375.1 undecaprenyl-diphosphate phosphatase [Turicibacter sp.]NCE78048.1 undecaprenyl-diphosphate phosphatase [Turicibacter sp. TS3]BEH92011.1 undecaprenyl-diphosphatase 1 [Turicibacter sp. TC023]MCU7204799.1 undecaprenyl-diphosphate phosphatase [Turicibacter sp. TA25]MCU7209506.1 undecaprenyl-diphosphate phosphatase [Turicibacter sp. 1E2]